MASKISTQLDQFYINNKIYIGPYTVGPNGSLYTGQSYNPVSSKLLAKVQTSLIPRPTQYVNISITPSRSDYKRGYIYRYFSKNILNIKLIDIIEIDKQQYQQVNLPNYSKFYIK